MSKLKNKRKVFFASGVVVTATLFLIVMLPGRLLTVRSQSNFTVENNTDRSGGDYKDFDLSEANYEMCQNACASDSNCRSYTYVRPGVQGASARCWLKSSVPSSAASSCCISGVKRVTGGRGSNTETDLAGGWYAAVKDSTGKWEYTMSLSRESAGKWTGTITITLNGSSPDTSDVAIESLGGGRISYTWRAGRPNAQQFDGTYTKDRISVDGFGGQLVFTRQ